MWASPLDLARYSVREGDLVIAEGGDVGRAEYVPPVPSNTIIQNSLHRVRPLPHSDLRFVRYSLEAIYSSGWLDVLCNKATFGHLTSEKLGALLIPRVSESRQGEVSDFLDAETARIDALVEKKTELIAALGVRASLLFAVALEARGLHWSSSLDTPVATGGLPVGWCVAHLSVLLDQLTNGYVGPTRDLLVDDGVRYVQSLHIKDGKIDFDRHPYYVPATWHEERSRIHLRPSDVLIVQTGDIGQVAVVPADFGPASCHALQIARVRRDLISGEYLGAYLRAPFGRDSLLSRTTGALHPHLEGGIRDIPVVVPPLDVQRDVVREVEQRTFEIDKVRSVVLRQIDPLSEHRRALITAAVTGDLDLSMAT